MGGVEKLMQMNEVERMREVMDILSDSIQKQNDKDRMEMLAMLASTTAIETNLMSLKFARGEISKQKGTKTTKNKEKTLMKGIEKSENEKEEDKTNKNSLPAKSNNQSKHPTPPVTTNTLAMRTKQALDKKNKLNSKGTIQPVKPVSTV